MTTHRNSSSSASQAPVHSPGGSHARLAPEGSLDLLSRAIARVAARCNDEAAGATGQDEVAEVLGLLAGGVQQRWTKARVDERARSLLGRRLLELIRVEAGRGRVATELSVAAPRAAPEGLDLLVGMAHDLRSPLTSVLFLAETLQRGQSGPVNDVQRRQLGLIYGAALGLTSVASDIIELARGGDQLVEKEPVPFSVRGVLESVREIVHPIAEEKQLALRLEPPTTDSRLGHPVALSRVLLNLTTNALKFTERGFVELRARETGPTGVEFAVRDSGKGIDPAILAALHRPGRGAAGRRGAVFSQTGLGLTICRTLLDAMGAELHVTKRPGGGTCISFHLELAPCRPSQAAPAAAP